MARVDRRRRDHPRGRRRRHRPGGPARAARGVRRPAAHDRLVLGGLQRDRDRLRHLRDLRPCCTEHGALSFWDFAAAAPYVDIEMTAPAGPTRSPTRTRSSSRRTSSSAARRRRGCWWPGASCSPTGCPTCPGGGTVAYVNPEDHAYLDDPAHREEGGTPAIIEAVRAGLVFQLKEAVGIETIRAREERLPRPRRRRVAARSRPSSSSATSSAERLSIVSFVVRSPSGRYLHHNFVVAVLNDLFGIQSRGGCSCAGPYGHRLLGIDLERSHEFEREITGGCEGIKPGWVRVNFNYFISDTVADYIIEAVRLVARDGWRLLGDYLFDPLTGRWRHRDGLGRAADQPARRPVRRRRHDGRCRRRRSTAGRRLLAAAARARARRSSPTAARGRTCRAPGRRQRRLRAPALVRPAGERDRASCTRSPSTTGQWQLRPRLRRRWCHTPTEETP